MEKIRYKKGDKNYKSKRLLVKLSPDELDKLEKISEKRNTTKSGVIHYWIKKEKV